MHPLSIPPAVIASGTAITLVLWVAFVVAFCAFMVWYCKPGRWGGDL